MASDTRLRVGDVAGAAGVHVQTLHYYERRGLLPRPGRTVAGYRLYAPDTVRTVRAIKRAQALGFTLADIRQLMTPDGSPRARRELFARKMDEIDRKIQDLQRLKRSLEEGAKQCECGGDLSRCELLAGLSVDHTPPSPATRSRDAEGEDDRRGNE